MSSMIAEALPHLQNFEKFQRGLMRFVLVAIPAAVVNSGLKYMQKQIQLAFMRRLTHHLHERYCAHRAYYAASVLGGALSWPMCFVKSGRAGHVVALGVPVGKFHSFLLQIQSVHLCNHELASISALTQYRAGLNNADQRITEDVEKFAFSISELYGYTFKVPHTYLQFCTLPCMALDLQYIQANMRLFACQPARPSADLKTADLGPVNAKAICLHGFLAQPLLDVLLFTRSLAVIMGYKGQFALYGYYVRPCIYIYLNL